MSPNMIVLLEIEAFIGMIEINRAYISVDMQRIVRRLFEAVLTLIRFSCLNKVGPFMRSDEVAAWSGGLGHGDFVEDILHSMPVSDLNWLLTHLAAHPATNPFLLCSSPHKEREIR